MNNSDINDKILAELQQASTNEKSPAQILMDVLQVSKESAYRRLRNEVKFTLEEASRLSSSLEFSLDQLIGNTDIEKAVFDLKMNNVDDHVEELSAKLLRYTHFFDKMRDDPNSSARLALNTIPFTFYLYYENLSRFKYYKWLYQSTSATPDVSYNDIILPTSIMETQRAFVAGSRDIATSTIILDRNVFASMKYDIEYFYNLKLISVEDVKILKEELIHMLNNVETVAKNGKYSTGKKVYIYISNVDLEASYSHFEHKDAQYSQLRLYGISGVETHADSVCRKQKLWIESHKRYSTVISGSGEMQRFQYFNEQREAVSAIVRSDI